MNAKLFQIRLLKRVLKRKKKGVLDRDPPRKPDSRTCERKALSERDSCVCILKMRAEAMHKRMGQSACADCAVGAKYYLAVRRSWSWLGRHLQCMWTHVVQLTIPITFWITIRNVFRNVILAHVNTANVHSAAVDSPWNSNVATLPLAGNAKPHATLIGGLCTCGLALFQDVYFISAHIYKACNTVWFQ